MLSAEGYRTRSRRERIKEMGWVELKRVVPRGAGVHLRALAEVLREAPAPGAVLGIWILHAHLSAERADDGVRKASQAELERRLDAGAERLLESALFERMEAVPLAAVEAATDGEARVNPLVGRVVFAFDQPHEYLHEALARAVLHRLTDQAHPLSGEARKQLVAAVQLPEDLRRALRWAHATAQPGAEWLTATASLASDDRPVYALAHPTPSRQLRATARNGSELAHLTVGGWDSPVLDAYIDFIAQDSPAAELISDVVDEFYFGESSLQDEVDSLDLADVFEWARNSTSMVSCTEIEMAPLIPATGGAVGPHVTLDQVGLGQLVAELGTSSRAPWPSVRYNHARVASAYLATTLADPADRRGFESAGFAGLGVSDDAAAADQLVGLYVSSRTAGALANAV